MFDGFERYKAKDMKLKRANIYSKTIGEKRLKEIYTKQPATKVEVEEDSSMTKLENSPSLKTSDLKSGLLVMVDQSQGQDLKQSPSMQEVKSSRQ